MKTKILALFAAVGLLAGAALFTQLSAQTQLWPIPTGVATVGQALVATAGGRNVQGTKTLATYTLTSPTISSATITGSTYAGSVAATTVTASTSATVGSSGTALTQVVVYSQSLTPATVATVVCADQTFTVTGLSTADKVIVNGPAVANAIGIGGARASATNTLTITFCNPTAVNPATPAAGTYTIVAIRS